MKKLVLTGAGGRLGSYLREPLSRMCDTLVSTDWTEDLGKLYPGETYVKADLGDLGAMEAVLDGAQLSSVRFHVGLTGLKLAEVLRPLGSAQRVDHPASPFPAC